MEPLIADTFDCLNQSELPGFHFENTNDIRELVENQSLVPYSQLISAICAQVGKAWKMDDQVNPLTENETETEHFHMEISGFLRETNCRYPELMSGPFHQRFKTSFQRLLLLNYLVKQLFAVKLATFRCPDLVKHQQENTTSTTVNPNTELAELLKTTCITLSFPKPPAELAPSRILDRLHEQLEQLLNKHGRSTIGRPMLNARLSNKQWATLMAINHQLTSEYMCRREMLIKRLDVTVQSFLWSDSARRKADEIYKEFRPIRSAMKAEVRLTVGDILSARDDLLRIDKVTGQDMRGQTKCPINRVIMGNVPDRGGRARELEAPPPEMPAFRKRVDQPRGQRGRGGRGGRGQGSARGHRTDSRHQSYNEPAASGGWQNNPSLAPMAYEPTGYGYAQQSVPHYQGAYQQDPYFSHGLQPQQAYSAPQPRGRGGGGRGGRGRGRRGGYY